MQEKTQKVSPVKQRILYFVDSLGISKREFYQKVGISRGTLESNTGITEETITKLLAIYANISPVWLLTGNGEMLINEVSSGTKNNIPPGPCQQCQLREKMLEEKDRTISVLEKLVDTLAQQKKEKNRKDQDAEGETYSQTA